MAYVGLVLGALVVILISTLWRVLVYLTWRPYAISRAFKKQGVGGPGYKFWSGSIKEIRDLKRAAMGTILDVNSHDITARIQPHYVKWLAQHGGTFLYWFGAQPRLFISDPEMVKQVLSNKFGFFTKTRPSPNVLALLGKGLVLTDGSEWARHRRIVSPAFTMDKLKHRPAKRSKAHGPTEGRPTARPKESPKANRRKARRPIEGRPEGRSKEGPKADRKTPRGPTKGQPTSVHLL